MMVVSSGVTLVVSVANGESGPSSSANSLIFQGEILVMAHSVEVSTALRRDSASHRAIDWAGLKESKEEDAEEGDTVLRVEAAVPLSVAAAAVAVVAIILAYPPIILFCVLFKAVVRAVAAAIDLNATSGSVKSLRQVCIKLLFPARAGLAAGLANNPDLPCADRVSRIN